MLFANAVSLLCASLNIGCYNYGSNQAGVIRITSLVPYSDNANEALSGKYSSATTNLQKKLKNTKNFGPNGIVQVGGFTFDEIDLETIKDPQKVEQILNQTDILYWSQISPDQYQQYYQVLVPWVQKDKVILLMTVDSEWTSPYTKAFGYTMKKTSNRPLNPTSDFTGPFGYPQNIKTAGDVLKIVKHPPYATPILKDTNGEVRGMQEKTKIIVGDGNWYLNELLTDSSDSCQTNDQTIFACNVFGSLVEKVKLYKN